MRTAQSRSVTYSRPLSELVLTSWIVVPIAMIIGAFLATQFFHLAPRYVKLLFGLGFLLTVLRLPLSRTMSVFLVLFAAPTFVFIGDTNVIFIALITVVWLARMGVGRHPPRVRSPIDWVILLYLAAHVLSFTSLQNPEALGGAARNMSFLTAGVLFYVLMVNAIRNESQLTRAMQALCVTALFVDITALAEHYMGLRLVPEWFIYAPALAGRFEKGARAGGVFGAHPLLADFSAVGFYLQVFLGMRTRRRAAKLFYYGLALLSIEMLFITANRGGAVIWAVGGIYFLWLMRDRLRWWHLAIAAPLPSLWIYVRTQITHQAILISRITATEFQRGLPDDRAVVWKLILRKIPEHPWIGHGPYLDLHLGIGTGMYWPHSAYLFYLYTTGIVGLLVYLWMLGKVIWLSRPPWKVDFSRDPLPRAGRALFHIQVLMFAVGQVRDEHQRGNVFIYFMWLLFALAMISVRLGKEGQPVTAVPGPGLTEELRGKSP